MKKSALLLAALLAAAGVQAENLIPGDSSFETGYGIWNRIGSIEKTETVNGANALKFTGTARSATLFDLKPGKPHVFSVWLKAEKPNTAVMLQVYRRNWDGRNITKHVQAGTEWTRYELAIPPQEYGDYNRFQLVIAQQNGKTVFADAVQLEIGEKASEYGSAEPLPFVCEVKSPVPGNLFLEGEDPSFSFRIFNAQKENAEASIELKVTDYYGRVALNCQEKPVLAPGQTWERCFRRKRRDAIFWNTP